MTTDPGPFPRANPGDPLRIPASAWNRMRDATLQVERGGGTIGRIIGGKPSPVEVLVKNATVTNLSRYDVMAIGAPLFGPSVNLVEFQTNLCIQGVAPSTAAHAGRWAVLLEPIAAGQIGRAVISGDTIALIDVTDADHTHAECNTSPDPDGDKYYRLRSSATGTARVLWKESGTGSDKWALIRIGDANTGGAGAAGAQPFRVKNVYENHLVCRTWDGTTDGETDTIVAKPYLLRHSSANYPWIDALSLTSVDYETVTVNISGTPYTWKVTLPYALNEVIWAAPTTLNDVQVSYEDALWEDENRGAHAWAEVQDE